MTYKKINLFITVCFIITTVSFLFYLAACFPGLMTTDSINQWREFVTHKYNDWHPVAYSLFQYLCTRFWYSPASVAIAQILILSGVFIYGINTLMKIGVNKKLLLITTILFGLYPANGLLVITLWKDVVYSIMLLWITILLIIIVKTEGTWMDSKANIVQFVICSLGVLFFRYNGILTFCCIILALTIVYRKYFKIFIFLGITLSIVYFLVINPISTMAGVVKIPKTESLGIPIQQITAVIHYNGNITKEQKNFFNEILPIQLWSKNYYPYTTNHIKFDKHFNTNFLIEHKSEFIKNWISVVANNPKISLKAYLNITSIVWKVVPYKNTPLNIVLLEIQPNEFGLKLKSLNNNMYNFINSMYNFTKSGLMLIVFWRPALWLYICMISAAVLAYKLNDYKILIVLIPILSNSLAYMMAVPSQDFRYQYNNTLTGFILLPYAIQVIFNTIKNRNNLV